MSFTSKPTGKMTGIGDDLGIALENAYDFATGLISPTLRLGVTGLSRAGKTVFITSMVHALLNGGGAGGGGGARAGGSNAHLPLFEPYASGRVSGARLDPQPSMHLPRFEYEAHLHELLEKRLWPNSTSNISELRIKISYESASTLKQALGPGTLNIDIVDYPGEWLLDLPLLAMDYETWSKHTLELSAQDNRRALAASWLKQMRKVDATSPHEEERAISLARAFTDYLHACRADENALSTLPPGRFLMPGDMEGSPALTFSPLETQGPAPKGSLHEQMQLRFEAYKSLVVKPFFRDHFVRLDRQIVLVDLLSAINAGPGALQDLQHGLAQILDCFNPGRNSWTSAVFTRRISRLVFAATKADHLHSQNHARLEAVLRRVVNDAVRRSEFSGASVDVMALSAVRSTQEATMTLDGEELPVIVGVPLPGEKIDGEKFDGEERTAIFPGDLPARTDPLFTTDNDRQGAGADLRFVRFRPQIGEPEDNDGDNASDLNEIEIKLPHIRMDKALQFLFADYLV